MPNINNGTGLIVSTSATFPLGNVGSYLGAPVDQRIYFRITNFTTDTLYYGFNWETLAPNTPITGFSDVYMNIYDPNGTLVQTLNLPTSGNGFISSWTSAFIGPQMGTSFGAGYSPLKFKPSMNGDYYVSFYRSSTGGVTHDIAESMLAKYFDLTVGSLNGSGAGVRYTGRVHCNEWAFSVYDPSKNDVQNPQSSSNAQFYTYTPDSVVAKVYFPASGFEPLTFIVAFNSFGVINNGNWVDDRRSIVLTQLDTLHLRGGYPVFLNVPDGSVYPVCDLPTAPQLVNPTISGCAPGPFNIRFNAPQPGDYYMLLDLNGVTGYQPNSADRWIELVGQTAGIITYVWDGKNGLGTSVPSNTSFPITFTFRKGRINIPFYDVELNLNGFSVNGVAPQNVLNRTLYWCDTLLYNVTSGTLANNYNTTGTGIDNSIVGQMSAGHAWSGNGNPGMTKPAPNVGNNNTNASQTDDFGNARLINTWAWGVELSTTQTLTLTCISVSGTVWDDADNSANGTFSNIQTNSETGTNAGNSLYASLIDPVTGKVISVTTVASNGTYTLTNCPANATGMSVVISTTAGVVGGNAPTGNIPIDWINTSPLSRTFNTTSSNMIGIDFGIEQLPNSVDQNYTIAMPVLFSSRTLNGTGTIASPGLLKGSDPEDGTLGSGKTVVITQVPSNEQLYYNGVLVTDNTTITNYDPNKLSMKFTSVTVTSTFFYYAYVDAAGKQDPSPAKYNINFSAVLATTLVSFTGKAADNGNALSFTDLNETNGVYFNIQRSIDGASFETIGRVDGGNSGGAASYNYVDHVPSAGTNYYRIQMSDLSGSTWYSNIVVVNASAASMMLEVAPNPFKDVINVKLTLAGQEKVSIRLLDSKGAVVRQAEFAGVKGQNALPLIGLSSLPVSVYFVQVVLSDHSFVRKVFNR
ncbi:MAG TPA: T9SS type A sorting domain-containing protein [Puia sp.]|jgi:hypothetical protein